MFDAPPAITEILTGDEAVLLAQTTSKGGAVLVVMQNLGLFRRRPDDPPTIALYSSVGAWRKLDRMRRLPKVGLAFHSREHGRCSVPHYVLMQGTAQIDGAPDKDWLAQVYESRNTVLGPKGIGGGIWSRWLHPYHWERVRIEVRPERLMAYAGMECAGAPVVYGLPLSEALPPSQTPPTAGTAPRVSVRRSASAIRRLPHVLLGWVGSDGFPAVAPVSVVGYHAAGLLVTRPRMVPPGSRRAGLTAHRFSAGFLGLRQVMYTGWLEVEGDDDTILFAPFTRRTQVLPQSRLVFRIVVGAAIRHGMRRAKRAGIFVRR